MLDRFIAAKKTYTGRISSLAYAMISTLLIILAGCASSPSQSSLSITPTAAKTATAQPTATPTVAVAPRAEDWTTYHNDNARTGYIENFPDAQQFTQAWGKTLDGAVYAEPLVINGQVIVATEGNSLYAFDAQTGQQQWHTNVGKPVPRSMLPCGNIDPTGITSTPVYDPTSQLVFAVAEVTGSAHFMVGLDVNTGEVKVRRRVDTPDMDPRVHQQRSALMLYQGMIYIDYGGRAGDCGAYLGRVIAARTDGQGDLISYIAQTTREGGMWAPPGPVMDDAGHLYVSVGNGEVLQGQWDHTDSVLRLSSKLQLEDGFAPKTWAQDNARDADLGSMSPVLLPNGLIFMAGKSGQGYLLHANALGGVNGQIQEATVCRSYGGAATANSQVFLPCVDGVRQLKVGPGETMTVGWHVAKNINGSPVVGGHTVYVLDYARGVLYALDSDQGTVRTSIPIGVTSRFATPTLSNGLVLVGTMKGVVAVKVA
jgi:outer membrane protein assembly factor BamB